MALIVGAAIITLFVIVFGPGRIAGSPAGGDLDGEPGGSGAARHPVFPVLVRLSSVQRLRPRSYS
jgi:hypothetical protein